MSARELVVLGTGSQAPSRARNHNGYLLRWDAEGFLFDPGEGTQRQLLFAGVPATAISRICLTHFHGDHCLGVPGIVQRLSLDGARRSVRAHYPASGRHFFARLRYASVFHERAELLEEPVEADGVVATGAFGELRARRLDHPVEAFGYQLVEPDDRTMLPDLLVRAGLRGPDVGELRRRGSLRGVRLEEVSVVRPGQRCAFVMDTRLCDNAFALAEGADLLVIESTFLSEDSRLAEDYGHLTAAQAARVAAECGGPQARSHALLPALHRAAAVSRRGRGGIRGRGRGGSGPDAGRRSAAQASRAARGVRASAPGGIAQPGVALDHRLPLVIEASEIPARKEAARHGHDGLAAPCRLP